MQAPHSSRTCASADVLRGYLAGQSAGAEARLIEEHVNYCPDCQGVLAGLAEDPELRGWVDSCGPLSTDPALETGIANLLDTLRQGRQPASDVADLPPPFSSTQADADPSTIGAYRVEKRLGRGGMGVVFKAKDVVLGRPVAIKILRPELTGESHRSRFIREARAAAQLKHDNVVTVHAVESPTDAPPYLVMEYVEGQTLQERIKAEKTLDPHEVAQLGLQVAEGLQAAHGAGLVHRDIKPGNIILDAAAARAKILDFGLARPVASPRQLTAEGVAPGTLAYMSPEQVFVPDRVDERTDLYALGATLYEALTGEIPFQGKLERGLAGMAEEDTLFPGPVRERIPAELRLICMKCLQKQPNQRYTTAGELAADLRRFVAGERPAKARRNWRIARKWVALALVVTALVIAAGVLSWQRLGRPREDSLEIEAFRGNPAVALGKIGIGCFETQFDDAVRVKVRFREPAYCYLIAFNPDGKDQLLYPAGHEKPARVGELSYPVDVKRGHYLNDATGVQAFVVVSSRKPLPPYDVWPPRAAVTKLWKRFSAKGVWEYDGREFTFHGAERGEVRSLGIPEPFAAVCETLSGSEGIE